VTTDESILNLAALAAAVDESAAWHAPDDRDVGGMIRRAARALSAEIAPALSALGVTLSQLPVLLVLFDSPDRTQAQIAREIGVEQPSVALSLRSLEQMGLVVRTRDGDDARRIQICLTPQLLALRAPIERLRADIERRCLRGVAAADRRGFDRALAAVMQNLAPTDATGIRLDSATTGSG
jgi:DNA-binding MarR family transcriptional regulator